MSIEFNNQDSRLGYLNEKLDDLLEGINSSYGEELFNELVLRLERTINDDQKNTYTAGSFYDFSNFKDNTTLNAIYPRGGDDGYVAKYNADGELQWTNTFGGASQDTAVDIKLDNEGNIIVLGKIVKTATF